MTRENAEYQALERVITADKRYRRFIYALSLVLFALVIWGGHSIQQSIEHKIDGLVNGAVVRSNQRSEESKTISRETIRYTTCIFVVPIEQRTEDTQQKCFEAADLPGGLNRSDFSPVVIPIPVASVPASSAQAQSSVASSNVVTSSSQGTTAPQSAQPNNVQPAATTAEILGIPLCVEVLQLCIDR
jgi:hypothetical protein